MFVTLAFLYAFVGFVVSTGVMRHERWDDDLPMVMLAIGTGIVWLPLFVAAFVLVAIDAALGVTRV